MYIASVSTEYPSPGSPRRGLFIQRRLAALGRLADVRVIHLHPWFPWLRPMPRAEALSNGPESPRAVRPRMFYLPGVLKSLDGYWVKRVVIRAVRALEAEQHVDVIDAHFGYPEGVGCALAAEELGKSCFITMRGLESFVFPDPWRGPPFRRALRQAAGVVCVSESLRELALRHGTDPAKVRVIPNAVDRRMYSPGDRDEARRALGLPARGRLIVCVGMLVHGKGQHLLVEALARLRPAHPDLRVALVGGPAHEPRHPDALRTQVRRLSLGEAVLMPGSQSPPQVTAWLRAADLFALPTYDEGCCNAVLEALACGLPVVTTPVGDNALLVDPPRRGLLAPVADAAALADVLDQALATPWDRGAIAAYGADYTWEEAARQTVEFFRERLQGIGQRTRVRE